MLVFSLASSYLPNFKLCQRKTSRNKPRCSGNTLDTDTEEIWTSAPTIKPSQCVLFQRLFILKKSFNVNLHFNSDLFSFEVLGSESSVF